MATPRITAAVWASFVGASTASVFWQGYCYVFPWYESSVALETNSVRIRARRRPPPIGQVLYPSSRALLELILDAESNSDCRPITIVEIGSGCGLTAVSLAAHGHTVIATDACPHALSNLRHNVALNAQIIDQAGGKVLDKKMEVSHPISAIPLGEGSGQWLPPPETRWLVGADLVYHGGASTEALCRFLAESIRALPHLRVVLVVADRFSGGAFAAVASVAGVGGNVDPTKGTGVDPALSDFENSLYSLGLVYNKGPLPNHVLNKVYSGLPFVDRFGWKITGTADGLIVYEITLGNELNDKT